MARRVRAELTPIATSGDRYARFSPYVASVNDAGLVAFQAERADGTHAVCLGDGRAVDETPLGEGIVAVTSHPDVNTRGDVSFYAEDPSGGGAVVTALEGGMRLHAAGFHWIGPAGPTMNERGAVAFRGDRAENVAGIHVVAGGQVRTIAEQGARFTGFLGLPLIDETGGVVFRADRRDGVHGIYRAEEAGGDPAPLVESGDELRAIAPFPSWTADGGIAFVGTRTEGGDGAWIVRGGELTSVPDGDAFETHRGCLVTGDTLIRIATPAGGTLGLFSGSDPERDRILGVGDALAGSTVEAFAANPVSMNRRGQLAITVVLTDQRELVLRADLA